MVIFGISSFFVAIVALIVSVFGILDVRDKVRRLLEVERDRAYTRVLNEMVREFLGPSDIAHKTEIAEEMHEFCMLAEVLDPKPTLHVSQAAANNEALLMAQELVSNGSAKWKDEMNVEKARAAINSWQKEKNELRLKNMFGRQGQSLL